ncbi:MAG: NTP transferase domain-containing protein [Gemmatimonadota bacterium]
MIRADDDDIAILILAGGRGARFGGPKQLEPVGPMGEPLAAYALYDAALAGFRRAVIVSPPGMADPLAALVTRFAPAGLTVEATEQPPAAGRTRPWGTAHAVLSAGNVVGEASFAVANADDFYGRRAIMALGEFLCSDETGDERTAVIAYRLERTLRFSQGVSRALCRSRGGWLTGIEELFEVRAASEGGGAGFVGRTGDGRVAKLGPEALVSMNLWGLCPAILPPLETLWREFIASVPGPDDEFMLPAAVDRLLRNGEAQVRLLETDEVPFGLTSRADLPVARARIARLVADGVYPADLGACS